MNATMNPSASHACHTPKAASPAAMAPSTKRSLVKDLFIDYPTRQDTNVAIPVDTPVAIITIAR